MVVEEGPAEAWRSGTWPGGGLLSPEEEIRKGVRERAFRQWKRMGEAVKRC